jgi:cytochrome P450
MLNSFHSSKPPKTKPIPGPKGLPLVGVGLEFAGDPLSVLERYAHQYGDLVRLPVGLRTMYLVNSPEYVKEIFKTSPNNFDKSNLMYREMSTLFGQATAIVDGERWKQGFKLIQPSFNLKAVEASLGIMQRAVEDLADEWASQGDTFGRDVSEDISGMTLAIIVRQMFGRDLEGKEETITRSLRTLVDFIAFRVRSVLRAPLALPTPRNLEYHRAIKALDAVMYALIERKMQEPPTGTPDGMLAQWIAAVRDGQVPGFQAKDLRDEVIGIFVAGSGSSSVFLSWILQHLAAHPEIQERARQELTAVLGLRNPTFADLSNLPYLGAVVEESMRLTPAGWIVSRSTIGWQRFGEYDVPPGSMLLISPYLLHRHPAYWERPTVFDPERFSPDRTEWVREMSNECRYIPFTTGKRTCTGRNMALAEAKIVFAHLLRRFRFTVPTGHEVTPVGQFTLGLQGGLKLNWEKLA